MDLYTSLTQAIKSNFPILQFAALSLVEEIISQCDGVMNRMLAKALNQASSLQSARDNIKELPIPLGQIIDEMTGKIGAVADIDTIATTDSLFPSKQTEFSKERSVYIRKNVSQLYSYSERIYLSEMKLKGTHSQDENIYEILNNLLLKNSQNSNTEDPEFVQMNSLRE